MRLVRAAAALCVLLAACGEADDPETPPPPAPRPAAPAQRATPEPRRAPPAPAHRAFFGDLHLHTSLSLDAYAAGARLLPDEAYRYAKGGWIPDETGTPIRRRKALDFAAVTDHAEGLGLGRALADPGDPLAASPLGRKIAGGDAANSVRTLRHLTAAIAGGRLAAWVDPEQSARVERRAWQQVIDAAERYDAPGRFTTFVAYEWTARDGGTPQPRNVVFAGSDVPERPFSALDSSRIEDLWSQMERWEDDGIEAIALPLDPTGRAPRPAARAGSDGRPAERRHRHEPVAELIDEGGSAETAVSRGYRSGLALAARGHGDPFRSAVVGSSGSHVAASDVDEPDFRGGLVEGEAAPGERALRIAAGLAGVWAEANTRDAIFAALRRGETFATSGPRIRVRLFAATRFPARLHERPDAFARAAERGVAMGGTLALRGSQRPTLLVWAQRDPRSAPLERIEIVKGWLRDGEPAERTYHVACSDGLVPDPDSHRCPDNGALLDLETCRYSTLVGAGQLAATWRDPDYEPGQRAVYYARAIENPSCRWTTWEAIGRDADPPASVPAAIRERAWSSPVWIEPASP